MQSLQSCGDETSAIQNWESIAPGVWRATVGVVRGGGLLRWAAGPAKLEALSQMPQACFPLDQSQIAGAVRDGRAVVRLPLGSAEQLYGLGLHFHTVTVRNRVFHLRVDHYGGKDNGRTHAPCPFYVSSAGYGVLLDTDRFLTVYAGRSNPRDAAALAPVNDRTTDADWNALPVSDVVEASVVADGISVLVFAGPTMLDAVRRFNLTCGGGCLPPKWGLGFWHRVPMRHSAQDVEAEVAQFREHDMPLDVVGLEPGWQSGSYPCTFEWDPGRFPDPKGFCQRLQRQGLRVNLWEDPYVSPHAGLHDALAPLSGSHLVWCGLVPDYTLPQAVQIVSDHHKREHLDRGVSGYKIDECDGGDQWLWPDHATFPSGHTGEEMRQTYGLQLQHWMTRMFRDRDQRTYGLVRASNVGGVGYPFVLYNDYYDHRGFVTALCNSGFCGVLWTPEARSAGTSEEWLRRIQSVCFSPLAMLNAWASGTKPWSFEDVEDAVRDVITLRARLRPYLYSAFARYCSDGTPPFRAMALEAGGKPDPGAASAALDGTENPYEVALAKGVGDQYMMGDSILVAPMFAGQTQRDVLLPWGGWCDFYSGEVHDGGRALAVAPGLERIPLFVRDGGIVPMLDPEDAARLEVRYYGHAPGVFRLYDDDGLTYGYERGEYLALELHASMDADRVVRSEVKMLHDGYRLGYDLTWWSMTR